MSKIILKRVVSGFMILLMVVGIFVAVSNFTATSAYAKMIILEEYYPNRLYVEDVFDCWEKYSGDCDIIIIHTGK